MKSGKPSGSVIGAVIMESILFIEIAIDLYTGKMSWTDLSMILTICLLLAIPIVTIMRKKRKNRESFHSKQTKKYNKIDKSTQD